MRNRHNHPIHHPPQETDDLGVYADRDGRLPLHRIVQHIDQLDDLIEDARRTLDCFDALPDARIRLERIIDAARDRVRDLYLKPCGMLEDSELALEGEGKDAP
jgi:hypothetical protein